MNTSHLAHSAYGQTTSPVRTHRGMEHAIFEQINARLTQASKPGSSVKEKISAIHDNRRLWTLLASDVASEDNLLPQALRAQIFFLCEFTLAHSRKILNDGVSIAPLIEVNTAVMRGLRGEAGSA